MIARMVAVLLLVIIRSTMGLAQTSEEYAVMGRRAWQALECSTLVDKAERADERQRLFDLGYQPGKGFIEAWDSGKVEWDDASRHVPIDVLDKLEPWVNPRLPTVDFRLGAIWESAARGVLDRLQKSEAPELFAMSEYNRRNYGVM